MPKNVQTTTQLHSSHTLCVMFRILQAKLQQYVNQELPDVQVGFRKGRRTRDQIANIHWIIEKQDNSRKASTSASAFDCVDLNKLWEKKEMGIPDHLTCLLRNLYAGQEARVRTLHGTMDWLQIGKGVHQSCILSPAYLASVQSTSCKMLGWMKHKSESQLLGELSITSDMQMTPLLWQKAKRN